MRLDLKYKLSIGVLKAIALLPLPILYILSDIVFVVVFYVVRYRRRVVRKNLELVFGEKSEYDIADIEHKFYRHLCDLIFETVKLLHISDKEMRQRFYITNGSLIDELHESGRSQVLMLGHYCNWEWVQALSMYFNCENILVGQIYQPLHNELVDRVMLTIRSRFGLENIPQNKAVKRLLGNHKDGKSFIVGFISDQRPQGRNFHNWTEFLGQDTAYTIGGEKIGSHIDANFVYLDIHKVKRGYYESTFRVMPPPSPEEESEHYYTEKFMSMFEESIYRQPEYWLWSHKRWNRDRSGKLSGHYTK